MPHAGLLGLILHSHLGAWSLFASYVRTDSNPVICLTVYYSELLERTALEKGAIVLKGCEGQEHRRGESCVGRGPKAEGEVGKTVGMGAAERQPEPRDT